MKTRGRIWLLYALSFILINAVIFLIPNSKTSGFIIAWISLILLFLMGGFVLRVVMGKRSETIEACLIGQKLLKTMAVLIAIQLLALAAVGLTGESIPFWIILIAEAVFLIVCLIILIRQDIARATVRKIEKDAAAATVDMKRLRSKAQALCATIDDPVNAKALQELADELQFSDPVSNSATSSYENRINTLLESIGHHQDAGERGELIRRAIALTKERAIVAKTNK